MVLYLEASTTKEEDRACTSHSSTLWTRVLIHSSERTRMSKPDYGAIFVLDMKQAQEMGFEFFQTLNSCAFCCSRVCMECLVSMFLYMSTETCKKTNGAVCANILQSRRQEDAPWKRNKPVTQATVVGTEHKAFGNSWPNSNTRYQMVPYHTYRSRRASDKRNCADDEKNSTTLHPEWCAKTVVHKTFMAQSSVNAVQGRRTLHPIRRGMQKHHFRKDLHSGD